MLDVFTVQLREGALEEWRTRHDHVWPELLEAQGNCGFEWMNVYSDDPRLIVVSDVTDGQSWDRLIATDVHKQWVASLAHLSLSSRADNTVNRAVLSSVLRLKWPGKG